MMSAENTNTPIARTSKLTDLWEQPDAKRNTSYQPVPHSSETAHEKGLPTWRIRLDPVFDPGQSLGLDINGEIILGRGNDEPGFVSLNQYEAEDLGVSRQHILLRPTKTKLYIIDLNSTNGTQKNGYSIGINTPYHLSNGDLLTLGSLEFVVRLIESPSMEPTGLISDGEVTSLLVTMARAITSQLNHEDVFKQTLETAMSLTHADETSIWLVDDMTGELFLEAEQGMQDKHIRHARLPVVDSLAGKVIETGQPLYANTQDSNEYIKVKTGYLVGAVLYVPLTLGGVTFGVLSAAHQSPGDAFSEHDEKLLSIVAEYAAIAVQNARVYKATHHALARQTNIISALDYALSHSLKNPLNATIGYTGLLESLGPFEEETEDLVGKIRVAGHEMAQLVDQMRELVSLAGNPTVRHDICELADILLRAVEQRGKIAAEKSVSLELRQLGTPYMIYGDPTLLYRSLLHLLDNTIVCAPDGTNIDIAIIFGDNDVIIRIIHHGDSLPDAETPSTFETFLFSGGSEEGGANGRLALALVWLTVEAHRGVVDIRNVNDEGVEFIITLPGMLRVS